MDRIELLFHKYIDNKCSPSEIEELLAYFNYPENEILLRELIKQSLNDDYNSSVDVDAELAETLSNSFKNIKRHIGKDTLKVRPIFSRTWIRIAAAAILIIGLFSIYQLTSTGTLNQHKIAKINSVKQDIVPGTNKATLTLSNGNIISLDSTSFGTLAQQGNAKVINKSGQIAYNTLSETPTEIIYNTVTTPRGGQYQLVLADGTKVWLNAASSLHFPTVFIGKERKVTLTGEAYFEVAKNTAMPFKVSLNDKEEVEVLGTHFNINSYSDEEITKTTLLEGAVKISTNMGVKLLKPGQQAQTREGGQISILNNADTEQVIAWKNGLFDFDNADLKTVLRQVSRWFDVYIVYEGEIPKREFSGEIERGLSLGQVLAILEKNNIHFRIEGKKLIVFK